MAYNYLITADDYEAAYDKIEEIKSSINLEFDIQNYDLEDESINAIIDEALTVSLFMNPKMIIIKNVELLSKVSDKNFNTLLSIVNNPNKEDVMIFITKSEISGKLTTLARYVSHIDVKLKNLNLEDYIDNILQKNNFSMDLDSKKLLLSYVDDDLMRLKTELDKLIVYKINEKSITSNDILLMVKEPLDNNAYELIEAIISKNKKRCFRIYNDLKVSNVMPSFIVSMLLNKFQEMYNVSMLIASNLSSNQIAQIYNVKSGRAYYMVKNAKEMSINQIRSNINKLNKLEYDIKRGNIDQYLGLELYFLS